MSMVLLVAACSGGKSADSTPPAPAMPEDWKVVADQAFSAADIAPVSERLGGEVLALRNTDYNVGGKSVRLNLIVVSDSANADVVMTTLRGMKPDFGLLRKGLTIYEFVAKDDAIPAVRTGKAHLVDTLR